MEIEKIDVLIQKYIDNTATEEEKDLLHTWYRGVNDTPVLWPYDSIEEEINIKKEMHSRLKLQITEVRLPVKSVFMRSYYQIAAIAAVLVVGLFLLSQWNTIHKVFNPSKQILVTTLYGTHKFVRLADGSTVWLGPGSRLQYPETFRYGTREITFEGEAFFEIAKDKEHPFIVHVGATNTTVLGTSFNIKAYREQKDIEVSLITGKVDFSDKESSMSLLPNERAVYSKGARNIAKQYFDNAAAIIARRDGEYQYTNVSVSDIAEDLKRNFNIKIKIQGAVSNCLFYGRIKKDESVEKFLKKMGIVVNAGISKNANEYLIMGGGCK